MKDLGSFGGTMTASVNGLNEGGEVVGGNFLAGDVQIHPFLWDGEKLIDLIAPPFEGGANGEAAWINEAGEVVGIAGLPLPCPGGQSLVQHAFLWRNGVITDLGTVAGTPNSQASFINSRTQIVGLSFACDFSVFNAILWEEGSMVDLNTLIPANSQFHLYSASFIDDHGQIAAFGILANGNTHAVLIPCAESNGDTECEDDGKATTAVQGGTNPRPNAVLPENLRMLLRQRLNPRYRFPGLGGRRD
jgi:probable HAF family extracellular repeat protein